MKCIIICTTKREEVVYLSNEADAEATCEVLVAAVVEDSEGDTYRMLEIEGIGKKISVWSNEIESVSCADLTVQAHLDAMVGRMFDGEEIPGSC